MPGSRRHGVDAHRLVVVHAHHLTRCAVGDLDVAVRPECEGSFVDWVFSGTLQRFPSIKIAYAESQVGWMPFQLERMDSVFKEGRGGVGGAGPLPSEIAKGRIYGCIFDDLVGLKQRDDVGIDQILFETDYPHSDGTFPHSRKVAHSMFAAVGMNAEECYKVLRGNAIEAYGLQRFGITE